MTGFESLTVVVVDWNLPDHTVRCVESLIADGVPRDRVVVVENGPTTDNWAEVTFTPLAVTQPSMTLSYSGDDTLQQELAALDAAVAGKAAYPVKPQEALRNVAVMEAMLGSSVKGGAWTEISVR